MRIIVFFDLPVTTAIERKSATSFRNFLLKDGYTMLQFSVYVRLCNSVENADLHFLKLKNMAPQNGSIRCMIVTEKQYSHMKIISGYPKKIDKQGKYIQLTFL